MEQSLISKLTEIRRTLHANPELGYQEYETSYIICKELEYLGIQYKKGIANTGVIATLGNGNGPSIALRADMDALPIHEQTGLQFASKREGLMHACGHDLHTTILLGAATLLKDKGVRGTIKFVFQPSEEGAYNDPDNKSGGQRIVETGELDDCKAALALHVHPLLPTGKMAYKLGQALANASFFKIVIQGKAGHAAFPHLVVDPIVTASHFIIQIQTLISRYTSPTEPTVISFTNFKIEEPTASNIIPGEVVLAGTIRALDIKTYEVVVKRIESIIKGMEQSFDVKIALEFGLYYPSLLNDKNIHNKLTTTLNEVFGKENIVEVDALLGGEDFAFYSRKMPSMFYFLGANKGDNEFFVHHPMVTFDERCIEYGSYFLSSAAIELLKNLDE